MKRKDYLPLKLLLIAIIVLQPVGATLAMAAGTCISGDVSGASMPAHGSEHDGRHHARDQANGAHQQAQFASDPADDDGCSAYSTCLMAGCGGALFTSAIPVITPQTTEIFYLRIPSWAGISLPTETKPPRSLAG